MSLSHPREKTKTKQKERLQRFTSQMWYSESLKGQLCARPPRAGATAGCRHLHGCSGGTKSSRGVLCRTRCHCDGVQGCLQLPLVQGWPKASSLHCCRLGSVGGGPGNHPEDSGRVLVVIVIWWKGSGCFEVSIRKWRGPCLLQW